MIPLDKLRAIWRADGLFRRVVRNSSYLFSSSVVGAALGMLNGILVTRLLGVDGYGLAVGTIILFASNVNNLLAFRMYEAVVKFVGDALQSEDKTRAAALVKGIGLAEALTSLLAYLILAALTPWAAAALGKDSSTAPLFLFYGLSLLGNLVFETARGVLQMTHRFDRLSQMSILQSALTTALLAAAFLSGQNSLWLVLGAYLLGKVLGGVGHALLAWRQLTHDLGPAWWRAPLAAVPNWRAVAGFALNTNLHATVNLFARDSIPNLLAYLRPAELAHLEVGYFRLAQGIISLMMLPIEPFIWPTYAEITRTAAARQWAATRSLLKRVSALSSAWTISAAAGLAALGWWLLPLLYGPDARPAYPAVLILLLGYGIANIFNWNRSLMLALGRSAEPLKIAALVGVLELTAAFLLVPQGGYLAMAGVLSGYFSLSIGLIAWRGLSEMNRQEKTVFHHEEHDETQRL